jgi:hypothetical protein
LLKDGPNSLQTEFMELLSMLENILILLRSLIHQLVVKFANKFENKIRKRFFTKKGTLPCLGWQPNSSSLSSSAGTAQQGPAHLHPIIVILQTRSSSVSTPPLPDAVPLTEMNATASSGYKKLAAAPRGALAPFVSLLLPSSPSRALLPVTEQRRHGRHLGRRSAPPLLRR